MSRKLPVSFRIPSKYVVFLDVLAESRRTNRTEALIEVIDFYLDVYLKAKKQGKL